MDRRADVGDQALFVWVRLAEAGFDLATQLQVGMARDAVPLRGAGVVAREAQLASIRTSTA